MKTNNIGGESVGEQVREKASAVTEEVKEQAQRLVEQARLRARQMIDQQKNRVADEISSVAHALKEGGRKLHEEQERNIAPFADSAAEQAEDVAAYVRSADLGTIYHDIEGLARRNPGLFVGGMVLTGFMLARFLKSSARSDGGGSWEQSGSYPESDTAAAGISESGQLWRSETGGTPGSTGGTSGMPGGSGDLPGGESQTP